MLKRRLQRLVRAYTCQDATLLEISGAGPYLFNLLICDTEINQVTPHSYQYMYVKNLLI